MLPLDFVHRRLELLLPLSVMTKYGLTCSGKGEIILRKTLRNETIAQLSDLERLRLQVYPFCFDVSMNSRDILCLQVFPLNVLKFDLYLLKQGIFTAMKRDLERAYLMIAGQSSHFTFCYWRCNFCTAIFH